MNQNKINDIFNLDIELLKQTDNLPLKPQSDISLLSEDQSKALEALNIWLYRAYKGKNEDNFFALTGSAGTGKTTLLATFLKGIKSPFRSSRICVCAPTHKAKKIVGEKTGWKIIETVQALLGIKADTSLEDFDPSNPAFNPIGDKKMKDYDIVIIDEGSMINTELKIIIEDTAKNCGTLVLYVGDTKQLNPIKEYTISLALTTPVNKYNLTQIMRQGKGNPLILLLDALRNDIEDDTSTYLELLKETKYLNDKGEGYEILKSEDFAIAMEVQYKSQEFREDKNYSRYITWTNESIKRTNTWVRDKIFNYNNSTIELDEIMLSYNTVTDGDDIIITNSDDYIVDKMNDSVISRYDYPLQTKFTSLRNVDTGAISKVHILERNQENYKNYIHVFINELDKAVARGGKKAWEKYYNFRKEIIILEHIYTGRKNRWGKDEYADKYIDYGYGITIHKSQGSTYNTGFVNGKDINKNPNNIERKRLWYVALSRASNKVYINL